METDEAASQTFRKYTTRYQFEKDEIGKSPCDKQCRLDTMCYAVSNDYDDAQQCAGFRSWELIPHSISSDVHKIGDGTATLHSLFPNMWSRSWWQRKKTSKK